MERSEAEERTLVELDRVPFSATYDDQAGIGLVEGVLAHSRELGDVLLWVKSNAMSISVYCGQGGHGTTLITWQVWVGKGQLVEVKG